MSVAERHGFTVDPREVGQRLDQLLPARVAGLSRRKARLLIEIGGVYVDGQRVKVASRKLRAGQRVEAVVGAALARATPQLGEAARDRDVDSLPPIAIVYEDEEIIVIDKPCGVLSAPTPEGDRGNVADQLSRRGEGKPPIFVVHRIDLPTSGLLVYAKSAASNANLSARFRDHDIERVYDALVAGRWPAELETISAPIRGKPATSHFALVEAGEVASRLAVTLETGRGHQIRIHCADAGHPVLGDRRYGTADSARFLRLALHARVLGFRHPSTGELMRFESPTPAVFAIQLSD